MSQEVAGGTRKVVEPGGARKATMAEIGEP